MNTHRPDPAVIYASTLIALREAKLGTPRRKELAQVLRRLRPELTAQELWHAHDMVGGSPQEEPV